MSISRRSFVKLATLSGALLIGVPALGQAGAETVPGPSGMRLGFYVMITPDGRITIGASSSEVGQGTWTSVAMLIAEELEVAFEAIEIEPLPLELERSDRGVSPKAFVLGAGGSNAISGSWEPARRAGAVARDTLRMAAARHWAVDIEQVRAADGRLHLADDSRMMSFAEAAPLARDIEIDPALVELKPVAQMRIVGTPQTDKRAEAIARGEPLFGIDQRLPGMLYATILRAPRFDAQLVSVDDSAARPVDGFIRTIKVPGPGPGGEFTNRPVAEGVAVVASTLWGAIRARELVKAEWTPGPMASISTADIMERADRLLDQPGQAIRGDGDARGAIAAAPTRVAARYDLPIVAHAALEPPGFIADVRSDGCTLIGSTQDPWDCMIVARAMTGLSPFAIEVRNVRCGGGFGRRLDTDYVAEAVLISKELGRPVRVHWSREDDLRHDFYRPLVRHRLEAGLDNGGKIIGWRHRLASTARYHRRGRPSEDYFIPEYWTDIMPARLVENMAVEYQFVETAIPFGPWRAPGHTANAFATESFFDEIAHAAGRDPLELRLELLGPARELPYEQHGGPIFDTGRLAGVLQLAAQKAGWGESLSKGRGRGIAAHFTFGTYVAHVVDVTLADDGSFAVDRVVSAVDCGIVVNPSGARAQNEGGINDALSTAIGQAITITQGRVNEGNFDSYQMMRIDRAACNIETHFVKSDAAPSGMGEAPVPPLAPALANALFAAGAPRIRSLPIADQLKV